MIQKIVLENWRSHVKSEFRFGRGTNVLVGNIGSGKSSVVSAICFGFFGTLPAIQRRELNVADIITNQPDVRDHATVILEFEHNGKRYRIERNVFRNKTNQATLYEDGRVIAGPKVSEVNAELERILGVSYDLFVRAVYSEQNLTDEFIRLSPQQRKEKFDELLGINRYEDVRKNAVTVRNALSRHLEEWKRITKEIAEEKPEEMLHKLEQEIKALKNEITKIKSDVEKHRSLLKRQQQDAVSLRTRAERFREISSKMQALNGAIKTLKEQLAAVERKTGQRIDEGMRETYEKQLKELQQRFEKLTKASEHLAALREAIKSKQEFLERSKRKLEELTLSLPENMRSKTQLADFEQKLDEKKRKTEAEIEELKASIEKMQSSHATLLAEIRECNVMIERENEFLKHVGEATASCPICKRPLSEEMKESLKHEHAEELEKLKQTHKEKNAKLQQLDSQISAGKTKLQALERRVLELEREAEKLVRYRQDLDELKHIEQERNEAEYELVKLNQELEKVNEELQELEKVKQSVERAKEVLAATELVVELASKDSKLKELKSELEALQFDEKELVEAERKVERTKSTIEKLKDKIESDVMLLEEKQRRADELREKIKRREILERRCEYMAKIIQDLNYFISALKAAQTELRESMLETINQAMADVWTRLYPYRDYVSAKIEAEGNSYEIKVKNLQGRWVRIEGTLSGGERSAAALTVRIAFSLVLAGNLGMLVLDEPTHNLDESTVKQLAIMLREHLPELIEQVFLITHDRNMMLAASASLYLVERDKDGCGASRPTLMPVREVE